MGLLDYADSARKKLRGLLGDMPIVQAAQGQANVSLDGLRNAMMAMRPFQGGADTAYEAALNIGPMGLGKIVYHGSPHKFDKFDASKIGTGEGAQAYGHGVYLADSPKVAESYRASNALSSGSTEGYAAGIVGMMGGEEKALTHLKSILPPTGEKTFSGESHDMIKAAISAIENGHYKNYGSGALYKADLPDEWIPKMLNYDLPISKQQAVVQDWARKMLKEGKYLRPNDNGPRQLQSAWDAYIMEHGGMVRPKGGEGIYEAMSKSFGSPDAASAFLKDAGIPGIRYLDGNSRGKGRGSYNYVVFPGLEDQVKILERNGVPLTGLLGGK